MNANQIISTLLKHDMVISKFPSIVYAKMMGVEHGEKLSNHNGDAEAALAAAVTKVLELTSVAIYAPSAAEVQDLCERTGRSAMACKLALKKHQGDQVEAAKFIGRH